MTSRIDTTIEFRRTQNDGPAIVYILPHRVEEFLKLGFSRDPLRRMQSLHPRYFEFFDIERAIFIETARVREARAIETRLKRMVREHRAPAPLDVRHQAGGETEWYRRAYDTLSTAAESYETQGYVIHRTARAWTEHRLREVSSLSYEWTSQQLRAIESCIDYRERTLLERTLKNALDALTWFDIGVDDRVPPHVAEWYLLNATNGRP